MDTALALSLVSTAIKTFIEVEPTIVKAISDLKPFAKALFERFTGKAISDVDRAALDAKIDELHAEFQAPIPAEEDQ